jgi:hypothetical protein
MIARASALVSLLLVAAALSACAGTPNAASEARSAVSGDCHPNYAGACLNPDSPDYDCAGGRGDGPDYTGAVQVIGEDPYGLDGDGDGAACEG